jgi:hypothetical protein
MFDDLRRIYARPKPFEYYTASDLWTDEHTSAQMLRYHLDERVDISSRNAPFIDRSVAWIVSRFAGLVWRALPPSQNRRLLKWLYHIASIPKPAP